MEEFKVGDFVTKTGGYAFRGAVVSVFENTKGQIRVVAEHVDSVTETSSGMLHIFSPNQLKKIGRFEIVKEDEEKKERFKWLHMIAYVLGWACLGYNVGLFAYHIYNSFSK